MDYDDAASLTLGAAHLESGWQEVLLLPSPAAGTPFLRRIPPETWEQVLLARVTLTCSAVVANRVLIYTYFDQDSNQLYQSLLPQNITAGQTASFFFAPGSPAVVNNATFLQSWVNIPDMLMPSLFQVQISVLNMDVGDQLSAIRFVTRRVPADVASGDLYGQMLDAWRNRMSR